MPGEHTVTKLRIPLCIVCRDVATHKLAYDWRWRSNSGREECGSASLSLCERHRKPRDDVGIYADPDISNIKVVEL
jgi:hypothetical protein